MAESVINPSDVVFAEASPAQQKLAWELNGVAWAGPMSLADYINRGIHLSNQELTKDGGCRYWILHPKDKPDDIIAGAECTRKTIFIRRPGEEVQTGSAYGVAAVYTNPAYRRLGMASHMMRCLQEEMDKDSDASVLYSEIGRVYYAQLGWAVFPSFQATLDLLPADSSLFPSKTIPLSLEDLPALCDRDVAGLKARLAAPKSPDGKTRVAFAPTYAQLAWQLSREEFMAKMIHGKSVQVRGAATSDRRAWIVWDHDWRAEELEIMRIATPDAPTEDQRAADTGLLLLAALEEAAAWGLRKVLVWNPDEATTAGIKSVGNAHEHLVKVVFDERLDEAIPSFRWSGGRDMSQTEWVFNECYAWC